MESARDVVVERGRKRSRGCAMGWTRGERTIKRTRDERGGLTRTHAFDVREQAAKGKGGKNTKGKKK